MKLAQINTEQKIDWLQHESHLRGLQKHECRILSSALHPVYVKEGDLLFAKGESNQEVFLIRNGHVKVGRSTTKHQWIDMGPYGEIDFMDDDGLEEELQEKIILGPGDCVGENNFFINHAHALTAIAAEEGEMLSLDVCQIRKIRSGSPHVVQCLAESLERSLGFLKL